MKDVYGRKKVISLEPFDLERFALHFHKCPDVVEAHLPDFETEGQYLGLIQAFTLAHFIVKDPVDRIDIDVLKTTLSTYSPVSGHIKII